MASESFTQDEVILYSSENGKVTAASNEIQELSLLLNRLPIHPVENKRANFRNNTGIARQIMLYRSNCNAEKRNTGVGALFFDVAFEYEDRVDKLPLSQKRYEGIKRYLFLYSVLLSRMMASQKEFFWGTFTTLSNSVTVQSLQ